MRTTPVDRALLHAVRHGVTLACLVPPLVLLGYAAPGLAARHGAAVVCPYAVLAGAAALLYLAYSRYEDPARYLLRQRPADPAGFPGLPSVPTVSALIAVRNDVHGVASVVRALAATEHPALEIIVVDAGSTDGTADVLDELGPPLGPPLTLLRTDRAVSQRRALRYAAEYATGDVLAFVGDGCLVTPDAIPRCVAALVQHPELGAVGAHTRARNASRNALTRGHDACSEGRFRVGVAAAAAFGAVTDLTGGLSVFRRDAIYNYLPAWSAVRPLASLVLGQSWTGHRLKARYADSPFVRQIDLPPRRWRVGYVRSARVYAAAPTGPYAVVAQFLRRAAGVLRAAPFTGRFAWRLGPIPAAIYYGRLCGLLLAAPAAAWHLLWEPSHGRPAPALFYLGAATLTGVGYGVAAAAGRLNSAGGPSRGSMVAVPPAGPSAGPWVSFLAYRPISSTLSVLLLPMLPAYAVLRGVLAAHRRVCSPVNGRRNARAICRFSVPMSKYRLPRPRCRGTDNLSGTD